MPAGAAIATVTTVSTGGGRRPPRATGPAGTAGTTDPTGAAGSAVAEHHATAAPGTTVAGAAAVAARTAGTSGGNRRPRCSGRPRRATRPGTAHAASTTRTHQQRIPPGATGSTDPTHTAGTPIAGQPASSAARAARRTGPAGAAVTAGTEHASGTAGSTCLPRCPRPAVTAPPEQKSTCATGGPRPRRSIGAGTDQRPTQQRVRRCIDRPQNLLPQRFQRPHTGRFRTPISARRPRQRPHEIRVKNGRLGTDRLILAAERAEQFRDRRRHLIAGSRHQPRSRHRRRRPGSGELRSDSTQVRQRCRQQLRSHNHKRRHDHQLPAGFPAIDERRISQRRTGPITR